MAVDLRLTCYRDERGRVRFRPSDPMSAKEAAACESGARFRAKLTDAARSGARNRWAHALFAVVAAALDDPRWTADGLKMVLKLKTGLVDRVKVGDTIYEIPKSTAFNAMTEEEFTGFCDRAVRVIVTEIMPGVERSDLLREIESFLGKERRAA